MKKYFVIYFLLLFITAIGFFYSLIKNLGIIHFWGASFFCTIGTLLGLNAQKKGRIISIKTLLFVTVIIIVTISISYVLFVLDIKNIIILISIINLAGFSFAAYLYSKGLS